MNQIGVPLHNHSEGSFLDGYSSVDAIAQRAVALGAKAFAITDHGEVNQHFVGQQAADKYDLKFIPGMEGYLVDSIEQTRETKSRINSHYCVFAENNTGLSNLWALSSRAYMDGFYYRPLADWEMLDQYREGLIITDGCMLADMSRAIVDDDEDAAMRLIGRYDDLFHDSFYMELHTWQFKRPTNVVLNPKEVERGKPPVTEISLNEDMTKTNQGKVRLAKKYGIPLIVVNDSHYACEHEWENHGFVWAMSTQNNADKSERGETASWIMSDDEMYFWMSKHGIARSIVTEALENTAEIADRCTARIEPRLHLPSLTGSPAGDRKLFLDTIEVGFREKVVAKGLDVDLYRQRVDEEVKLITEKQFDGYFNIVSDYVLYAKEQKHMLIGAGRGSGGGSIVNFLMGITSVDAIKYDLLFSRFLNEARVDMPDIDVDFPQSRRKEITEGYIPERYGQDSVCVIGTLTRSQPAGITKDLCRAMQIPYDESNDLTKIFKKAYLPQGLSPHEAWETTSHQLEKDLAPYRARHPQLFDKIDEMVGLIRQSSTHAAGVLISDVPLLGEIPLRVKGKSSTMPVTQFENSEAKVGNDDVTKMGYIKYDFLGLRTLDTLEVAFQLVKERRGLTAKNSTEFYENFGDKEYQDAKTWDMVASGDTLGIFQIETSNALPSVKRMKPRNEIDMADLTSIIRPGVVQAGMLTEYFDRRDGKKRVTLPHPLMETITARTYGIVVYQEQALKVFLQIAQSSPAEAEKIRKMMGKKKVEELNAKRPEFVQRCLGNPEFMRLMPRGKDPRAVAEQIWHNVEATGSYAFNEAHAIGYSLTACQCAYMKANYPAEFLTALLRTDPENKDKYIRNVRKHGIKILPPDVNESQDHFTLVKDPEDPSKDAIRYGITSVFGVADVAYKDIEAGRPYESFEEFLSKTSKRACNAKVLKNLICIGAFDSLGQHRATLLTKLATERKIKDLDIPDFDREDIVEEIEMDLVGSFIAKDPMERYNGAIEDLCLAHPDMIEQMDEGDFAHIGGQLVEIKHHTTKKGDPMAWIKIAWNDEIFEVVVFPQAFAGYNVFFKLHAPVALTVKRLEKGCMLTELIRLDME